jgi:hypothetical protein
MRHVSCKHGHQHTTEAKAKACSGPIKFDVAQVSSVYSGKANHCCCGCAGKHAYAEQHREWAGKNRGYAIEDDEVSNMSVRMVVRKTEDAINSGSAMVNEGPDCWSVDTETRTYVVYMKS